MTLATAQLPQTAPVPADRAGPACRRRRGRAAATRRPGPEARHRRRRLDRSPLAHARPSGRCRSRSGATATARGSSPGGRPRTCRRSGRLSGPCATWRSDGTATSPDRPRYRRAAFQVRTWIRRRCPNALPYSNRKRLPCGSTTPIGAGPFPMPCQTAARSIDNEFVDRTCRRPDLPAPAQDCQVAVVRAPPRAVTPRKEQRKEAPAPALSSRPSPRERTDATMRQAKSLLAATFPARADGRDNAPGQVVISGDLPRASGRTPLARPHCHPEPLASRAGQTIDEIRIRLDYNFPL